MLGIGQWRHVMSAPFWLFMPGISTELWSSPLTEGQQMIGRSPECGIKIADRHVSRHHAIIELSKGHLHIRDLQSSNGTFVNGKRLREGEIHAGDQIRFGRVELVILSAPIPGSKINEDSDTELEGDDGDVALAAGSTLTEREKDVYRLINEEWLTGKTYCVEAPHVGRNRIHSR